MAKSQGHKKLEEAYQHFLRTASDYKLDDEQRQRILNGIDIMLDGRKAYEALILEIRGESLQKAVDALWLLPENPPPIEALEEGLEEFFQKPIVPPDEESDEDES